MSIKLSPGFQSKVEKAQRRFLKQCPLWAEFLFALEHEQDDTIKSFTTCDGKKVVWNEEKCVAFSHDGIYFILQRNILSCVLGHDKRFVLTPRMEAACNFCVNGIIIDYLGVSLLALGGELKDMNYSPTFRDQTEKEIYAQLPNNSKPDKLCSLVFASPTTKLKWEGKVETAARSKAFGKLPQKMQSQLTQVKVEPVDWRAATYDMIQRIACGRRNNWSRVHRRHITRKFVVPAIKAILKTKLLFVRDTSGSIGADEANLFSSHIVSCCHSLNCEFVVMDCDAAIHVVYENECPAYVKGGGDTDFNPPFQWIKGKEEDFGGIIYLTDLYGPEPLPEDVTLPTLWCVNNNQKAKTGRTIKIS